MELVVQLVHTDHRDTFELLAATGVRRSELLAFEGSTSTSTASIPTSASASGCAASAARGSSWARRSRGTRGATSRSRSTWPTV